MLSLPSLYWRVTFFKALCNMHADAHSLLQIPCNNVKGIDGLRSPTSNESRMIDNCLSELMPNQKYSAGGTAASSFLFAH